MSAAGAIERREITPGVHWLGGCFQAAAAGRPAHYHVSTYLVVGERRTVLVDTGDPLHWPTIERQLVELLGERPLDYVMPTHPELPHAGNLPALARRYPGLEICGDVRDYHIYFPEVADHLVPLPAGARLELGGRALELLPALISDLPNTLWAYDDGGGVLFSSDGFPYLHQGSGDPDALGPTHLPGQCQLMSTELGGGPTVDDAAYGTGRSLYWTRFVDISDTFEEIAALFAGRTIAFIAPCHGNVIADPARVVPISIAAHRQVYQG
jgi:glyoxylase-like metal-dependent hydrolase (beta-lactamase superfamily II)